MAAVLNVAPGSEPVSLTTAKTYLRVDGDDEDDLITGLICAARMHTESLIDQKLISQKWSIFCDNWPDNSEFRLSLAPIISVDKVLVYGQDDVSSIVSSKYYYADTASRPARLVLRTGWSWPEPGRAANGVEVRVTAGYGTTESDVPKPLRVAILQLMAHWFENREPIAVADNAVVVPQMVAALLAPYRRTRLS